MLFSSILVNFYCTQGKDDPRLSSKSCTNLILNESSLITIEETRGGKGEV